MTKYNGWTNYETWNVALWLGNDEPIYSTMRDARHLLKNGWTAELVEVFIRRFWPNGTPDFASAADYDKVNWAEVARHLNED